MSANDYARIEKAILFLESNFRAQPNLTTVARHVGLSEFHFQRLFRRWSGVSPKRFVQFLTAGYARELLQQSRSVLEAALESGLSGSGRLHDLMVNVHAATPGELRRQGVGLTLRYGVHATPFGPCLVALTDKGICALAFTDGNTEALEDLRRQWPRAALRRATDETRAIVNRVFAQDRSGRTRIDLHLPATNFQIKVWEALIRVPPGTVLSYETLAEAVGAPSAARAVASAVARNPIAYLIPCHRVIRKSGAFGKYRWGETRKQAILAWEASRGATAMPVQER
jgi:AraC family transcriptional regulator of adaptative response/methylated-DNA-[protein]-cysteine methyltransferase